MTASPAPISSASYYASDNYYTQESEGPSEWGGRGAHALNLSGQVDAHVFADLLDGKLPNGVVLAAGANGERNLGTDITFSAPKSVSLIGLLGGDERVIKAHRDAVRATMAWAEERFALARAGKGGAEHVNTGTLVHAAFHHDLSRKLDPQLHTHVAIANATRRPDGTWRALHNVQLWQRAPLIGAAYHAQLRANLAGLGYETTITGKHGSFEIAGVSQNAIDTFSKRSEDIRAKADELGLSSPKAMEGIALRTRDAKQSGSGEAARAQWAKESIPFRGEIAKVIESAKAQSQARSVLATVRAWGETLLERIGTILRPIPEPLLQGAHGYRKGADLAGAYSAAAGVRHLAERSATFEQMDLVHSALGFAEKGATVREIENRIDALVGEGVLIRGRAGDQHADRLTTRELRATEHAIITAAEKGAGSGAALVDDRTFAHSTAAIEARRGFALSDEQKNALGSLLTGKNLIQIVQGDAGTGKSTLFAFVNEIASENGKVPLFLTSQAALVASMREDGLDARTLASVLVTNADNSGKPCLSYQGKELLRDRLVIVEEASMLSTRDAAALIVLARNAGAIKLAFVGDDKQIDPVQAGRAFSLMQEYGAPTEKLAENRRQLDPILRDAVEHARAGRIGKAFETLGERVVEHSEPALAAAERYLALSPEERDATSLLTSGHVLREAVLDRVRESLIDRGEIGSTSLEISALDRLNLTREELRNIRSWGEGMRLELYRDQAGLERGRYEVGIVSPGDHLVQLKSDGDEHWIDPRSFHPSGSGASLAIPSRVEVREGDRLLFTAPDKGLDVVNGTRAIVAKIEGETLHLTNGARDYVLGPDHPMRERLGHAVVLNMHRAQGITVDRAIAVMSSDDHLLNSENLHYVLQTRAREDLTLVTNDKDALADSIESHRGSVAHAMDLAPELRDTGGEAFDPKTGELLDKSAHVEPAPAEIFERTMSIEFPTLEKEPEPQREKELERDDPDITDDFEMEM